MSVPDPRKKKPEDPIFSPEMVVGSYRIESVIGEGGMGTVFFARHVGLDKPVAIKALHPELARNDTAVARFLREGRALSKIRHPHVIAVSDVGTYEGVPYLVMDYLEGEDLEKRLERQGRFTTNEIARIMLPVLDALATAHEAGVVHRDLKPSNIFLARSARGREVSMVLDFGIAKIIDQPTLDEKNTLTRAASFLGTPYYASPEQARSVKHVDARTDQYALGAILFELSSGETSVATGSPFEVLVCIVANKVRTLRQVQPDVDPAFEALVQRAISFSADDRFADVREMGRALLAFADPSVQGEWQRAFELGSVGDDNPFVQVDEDGYVVGDDSFATTLPSHDDADIEPDTIADGGLVVAPKKATLTLAGIPLSRSHLFVGGLVAFVGVLGLAVLVTAIAVLLSPSPPDPIEVTVEPADAEVTIDGAPRGAGGFTWTSDRAEHDLVVRARGHVAYEAHLAAGEAPPSTISLEPLPHAEPDLGIGGGFDSPPPALEEDAPPEASPAPETEPDGTPTVGHPRRRARRHARRLLRHLR